jgi:hypothetical protein
VIAGRVTVAVSVVKVSGPPWNPSMGEFGGRGVPNAPAGGAIRANNKAPPMTATAVRTERYLERLMPPLPSSASRIVFRRLPLIVRS